MKRQQQTPGDMANGVTDRDAAHITALFHESRPALVRYLQSRLRGSAKEAQEEARELAQDAYLRLLRRRKRRKVTHWKELLWCTARNLATNDQQGECRT
jgi:DNA-directed RNA polymerase specialized sigma24 family protein